MNGTGEQTAALNHEDLAQLAWRHWQTRPGERGINQTSRNPKIGAGQPRSFGHPPGRFGQARCGAPLNLFGLSFFVAA